MTNPITEFLDQTPFSKNTSARVIMRSKIESVGKDKNKYNPSLLKKVEEDTGFVFADERNGSDTGSEMELPTNEE